MTLAQLKDRIMSWPENTMNFRITDVFSWRGSYIEPACSISTELTSKADNLKMIDKLLSNTFMGWKGGKYTYHQWDDVNFEDADSSWSDGQYNT